jgi:hypothetical protein
MRSQARGVGNSEIFGKPSEFALPTKLVNYVESDKMFIFKTMMPKN